MEAMGQGSEFGSYYMNDNRNIWRMPHAVNQNSNFVITEWGDETSAEGGFFNSTSSLNYGLYLNSNNLGNVSEGINDTPDRFDVFVGGNTNMNWGARIGYQSITDKSNDLDEDASGFDLSVSAELSGANVWLTYVAATDGTIKDSKENNADISLGANYMVGDYTAFAEYQSEGNAGDADATTAIVLGAGRTMLMSDSATVFYDAKLVSQTNQAIDGEADATDASSITLPVTFGVEAKATSWLTLRASLSQAIYSNSEYKVSGETFENSSRKTTLGVGASLTYGNLLVDGVVSSREKGTLGYVSADGNKEIMSNVSMTYVF
jgi:hypothetical protein